MVSWKHNQLIYLNIVERRSNFTHQDLENWFASGFRHCLLLALVSQKGEWMQGDASFNPGVSEDPEITWNDGHSSTLNRANRPWRGRRASLTPHKFRGLYLADASPVDLGSSSLLPMCYRKNWIRHFYFLWGPLVPRLTDMTWKSHMPLRSFFRMQTSDWSEQSAVLSRCNMRNTSNATTPHILKPLALRSFIMFSSIAAAAGFSSET